MKPHKLIAIGEAPLVTAARGHYAAVKCGPLLDSLAILLEPRENLLAVMDLKDPGYGRELSDLGPTRLEYDLDYVVTGVGSG